MDSLASLLADEEDSEVIPHTDVDEEVVEGKF